MQTFIESVVEQESKHTISESIFVLPSKRASNNLRRILAKNAKATTFAPEILSIDEFIEKLSGLKPASNLDQIFSLYTAYKNRIPKGSQESFDVFCGWAQTVLSDFNEIDRYIIDQKLVFDHIAAYKEIETHWSHNPDSSIIKNYIAFWNELKLLYTDFCELLSSKNLGHQGLLYRTALESVEHYIQSTQSRRHVFIGFNALNTSEQQIFQAILQNGSSEIYWDADRTFMSDTLHEAGLFLKEYKASWPYFKDSTFKVVENYYSSPKTINIYSAPQSLQQAKGVGSILRGFSNEQLNKTALVLADENLLIALLNSLPPTIKKVNVTMGVPLGMTPVATFFDLLFQLKRAKSDRGFYYNNILALLRHPLSRKLIHKSSLKIEKYISAHNAIHLNLNSILSLAEVDEKEYVSYLFEWWSDDAKNVLSNLQQITEELKALFLKEENYLQLEYLYGFKLIFNQLEELNKTHGYIETVPVFYSFYKDILSKQTVDLRGSQEDGLQIMGVLESRTLDYENVIITSVNEGVLPSGKSQNSYIPYDLKRSLKLPTYQEKDAIYAYHFYRLLHRAKRVDLFYTTESTGIGSSEMSRFLKQIEFSKVHNINYLSLVPLLNPVNTRVRSIKKTPEIISQLKQLFKSGISPSALTTYLRNPIQFYERYILGIRDAEEVEETIAANTMGTIVHDTLEKLYTPYVNELLTTAIITHIKGKINDEVLIQFKKTYGLDTIGDGKNLIIYKVIERYVENYLQLENKALKNGDEVIIKSLEESLSYNFKDSITLKGKVDIVELRNGELRVIDYKTGKVENKNLDLKEWEDLTNPEKGYEKALQVLMYSYIIFKSKGLKLPFKAGVISFKNLKAGFLPFTYMKNDEINQETFIEFEKVLENLINEILDEDIPFTERSV